MSSEVDSGDELRRKAESNLPYVFRGCVIHGFGRGDRTLNCPTANLDEEAVDRLPAGFENGVYAGFARLLCVGVVSTLIPMVMSVGFNPQFHNQKKTLEVHILKKFDNDFYGAVIEGVAVKYLRPMKLYSSLTELMSAIVDDKREAATLMNECLRDKIVKEYFSA